MITLNFISEKSKCEIRIQRFYSLLKRVELILIIFSIFISVIFVGAEKILLNNYHLADKKMAEIIRTNASIYKKETKKINDELAVIAKIQGEHYFPGDLINAVAETVPPEISLNYLQVDLTGKTIRIKGQADNRDDLLRFKEKLDRSEIFSGAVFPLQNITLKERINFDLNLKFDPNKLPNF